ncbi:M16 family metallopeptidase [Fusobacterium varium]|uniref:M16 family metallopeptidase n=1 Tax=Fusobacterium varium TaxID=856 RepID=UPI00189919A3|nr:M16 family metallopeptidase [Fusobacterium varium]
MQKFKRYVFAVLLFIFSITVFSKPLENSSNLITGKLPNGITYYIYKNKKPEEKAELNLVVKAGSLYEEEQEQGLAHFLEHMAFNGTTKYEKNDMIKYLQSLGLNFGGDLNAYTSFDRTVYKLQIPSSTSEDIEKGVEVLREWATEVTLAPDQVASEKKVIIEEWRLRQGLSQRLGDIHKKAIFGNSRYFDRFPIGLTETINGATSEILKGFYDKWYLPENMSVIAVGDFDPIQVENIIKKYFNYTSDKKYTVPEDYKLAELENKYIVFTDPEITYNTFYMTKILDRTIVNTEEGMKANIIDQLLFNILNTRLSNLCKLDNSPLMESLVYKYSINNHSDIFSTVASIRDGRVEEGTALLNAALKTSVIKGINKTELELEKKNIYNSYKALVANKESIQHGTYIDALVEYVMSGDSFLDIDKEFELFSKELDDIKLSDLNKRIEEIYNANTLYFITAPSNGKNIPNDKQLEKIMTESRESKDNLLNFSSAAVELPPIQVVNGKIIEASNGSFILSNGIKVLSKSTDFDKDKIYIKLFKKEGSSVDTYPEYLNSLFSSDLIISSGVANISPNDLENFMKGKNFSLSPYINDYEQGFSITTDKENLIPALEYMNYTIKEPKIDDIIFKTTMENTKESILNRNNSPRAVYNDEISKIYSGNNQRRLPLSLEDLKMINKDEALNEFKKKFDDFNGYNLLIVGSFDEKELPTLLEKYFASLPNSEKVISPKPLDLKIPKNIVKKEVVKGVDKKSTVTLIFPYNGAYGEKERILYNGFSRVLNIALIEDIREKIGGVYSISSKVSLSPNNFGEDKMIISFSCDTKRTEELKNAVLKTVSDMLNKNIDQKQIDSIIKNYELSYKNELKENIFWLNYFYQKSTVNPEYKVPTPEEYAKIMQKKDLMESAKKAINLNNYIDVTLVPEKESL